MAFRNLAELALGDFTPHLNTSFEVAWQGRTLSLTLVLAAALTTPEGTPPGLYRDSPFQLQFEEPGWTLPQQIHEMTHPVIGELAIFLVPIGPNREKTAFRYQAAFT